VTRFRIGAREVLARERKVVLARTVDARVGRMVDARAGRREVSMAGKMADSLGLQVVAHSRVDFEEVPEQKRPAPRAKQRRERWTRRFSYRN
jgi:hypothetical protein